MDHTPSMGSTSFPVASSRYSECGTIDGAATSVGRLASAALSTLCGTLVAHGIGWCARRRERRASNCGRIHSPWVIRALGWISSSARHCPLARSALGLSPSDIRPCHPSASVAAAALCDRTRSRRTLLLLCSRASCCNGNRRRKIWICTWSRQQAWHRVRRSQCSAGE